MPDRRYPPKDLDELELPRPPTSSPTGPDWGSALVSTRDLFGYVAAVATVRTEVHSLSLANGSLSERVKKLEDGEVAELREKLKSGEKLRAALVVAVVAALLTGIGALIKVAFMR